MTHTKPFNLAPAFSNLLTDILENNPITEEIFGKNNFMRKPATNITEKDKAFEVALLVPGFDKKDFILTVEKNILTVSTQVTQEPSDEKIKSIKSEFEIIDFKRSFSLSENIDTENIQAKYDKGILVITLIKKVIEQIITKKISVE